MDIYTTMVPWDEIISVIRRAGPKTNKYGRDLGGSTPHMIAMLKDDQIVSQVAKRVYDAKIARDAAISKVLPILDKAEKDYRDTINAIVADISK